MPSRAPARFAMFPDNQIYWGKSIADNQKRKRGRPATGVTPMTGVRIPTGLAERLNAWIDRQPDPKPTRAEAIRRLMERGLSEAD